MIVNKKRLYKEPFISRDCNIINTKLGDYTEVGIFNFFENVNFGDFSYTGQFCFVQNAVIGKFCNIAPMVRIGATSHPVERPTMHHFTYRREMFGFDDKDDDEFFLKRESKKVYIGHDTWIGHGVVIMPGIKIGNGAVVGAGAVVTKDVEAYSIVGGVPAKEIKKRFEAGVIKKLESIEWWNWSYEKIKENFNDFLMDIDCFVEKHYEGR